MDRTRRSHAPVRYYQLKQSGFLNGMSADLGLIRSCCRIRGWCYGSLARGATYFIWNKHAFAKRSGLRMHYVEEAMRKFRKTTTEFDIEEVRIGRSPRLRIAFRGAPSAGSPANVRNRLVAYIRKAAALNQGGVAKVDARFLEYFCHATGYPREVVGQVWLRLKFVPGCHTHWRGVGANLKFIVSRAASLQESSLPHGSPSGRRDKKKTVPAGPAGSQGGFSTAAPHAAEEAGGISGRRRESPTNRRTPCWPRISVDRNAPEALNGEPETVAGAITQFARARNPLQDPFTIHGRWISGEKVLKLAGWLAVEPLQAVHGEGKKVRWRFAHARNFAARALRGGYRVPAIVAAYRAGVQRSHDDAGMAGETARDHAQREPSAAVYYAWQELFRDPRSREDRWRSIFDGERAPRSPRVRIARQVEEPPAPAIARPAYLPPAITGKISATELIAWLKTRNMTLAELNKMPHDAKIRLVQSAINQRDTKPDSTN